MNKPFSALRNLAANQYARAGALVTMATPAFAQSTTSPIDTLFDGVDFSGIATKVVAMGAVIIGIVVAFKGVDLVKRVIRKV